LTLFEIISNSLTKNKVVLSLDLKECFECMNLLDIKTFWKLNEK